MVEVFLCFGFGGVIYFLVLDKLFDFRFEEFEWARVGYTLLGVLVVDGSSRDVSHRDRWVPFVFLVRSLLVLFGEARLKGGSWFVVHVSWLMAR